MSKTRLAFCGGVFGMLPCLLSAGTIITANLPSNTAIINIDARADGAATFNGSQSLWFHPFNTSSSLLEYTIQPGTYNFRIVDGTDAGSLFPSLTAPQISSIFTAWTFNAPWVTDYLVFDSTAATDFSKSQLLAGAISPSGTVSAITAYNAAISGGYFNQVIIGDILAGSKVTQFTFNAPETLIFTVPDNVLSDNTSGVSVLISPVAQAGGAVPEPGSVSLMLAGVAALYLKRRSRA